MFDTICNSMTFQRAPDDDLLKHNGGRVLRFDSDGKPTKYVLNGAKGLKNPRITISKNPRGHWHLHSEVSIPNWLYDSSLSLPDESDIETYYDWVSSYVGNLTGIEMNPRIERLNRFDVTKDIQIGENKVIPTLIQLENLSISKYLTYRKYPTTVYIDNKGKQLSKRYNIYSKYHQLIATGATIQEIESARGIIRVEVQHRVNRAVSNLAKSLKYPDHTAQYLLTKNTYEAVMAKTIKMLSLEQLLSRENSSIENLFDSYGTTMGYRLSAHLLFEAKYGTDYFKIPFFNTSEKRVKELARKCVKVGSLSLE